MSTNLNSNEKIDFTQNDNRSSVNSNNPSNENTEHGDLEIHKNKDIKSQNNIVINQSELETFRQQSDAYIVTRTDLTNRLLLLESKLASLTSLVEENMKQPGTTNVDMPSKFFRYQEKHPRITRYTDAIFRTGSVYFTICHVMLQMAITTWMCLANVNSIIWETVLIILILLNLAHLVIIILVSLEMVARLIKKQSKLIHMIQLYFSLLMLYASIYTLIELVQPGSFSGLDAGKEYHGLLKPFQMYIDFLYFSSITFASVGFGDIYGVTGIVRVVIFTETVLSVAFLSILFSNWVN